MARIEISMEEYDALKGRINELEKKNIAITRENEAVKDKLDKVEALVFDLGEVSLIDRIFSWKEYIKELTNLFPQDNGQEEQEE